jgi:hypothetical protein
MNILYKQCRINHLLFLVFIVFFTCAVITPCIAQEKTNLQKQSANKTAGSAKILIRARSKGDFMGSVANINLVSKTITVKNKGVIVTFDVLNPVFKGYKNLEQIRVGDKVAISYTGDGTRITKATDIILRQEAIMPHSEPVRQKHETATTNKGRPIRVKERTNSIYFRDVDNNSDGKITPVELSAVIPDLTVQDFKKYDRNGDGCLNESEYNTINKPVSRSHSR